METHSTTRHLEGRFVRRTCAPWRVLNGARTENDDDDLDGETQQSQYRTPQVRNISWPSLLFARLTVFRGNDRALPSLLKMEVPSCLTKRRIGEHSPETPWTAGHVDEDNKDQENMAESEIMQQMRQSANFKSWMVPDKTNRAAEHGIIEEIFCQNFMCHPRLKIALGSNINFIIGHNGSGKSAVLTALTITLGVKATATNLGCQLEEVHQGRTGQRHDER